MIVVEAMGVSVIGFGMNTQADDFVVGRQPVIYDPVLTRPILVAEKRSFLGLM